MRPEDQRFHESAIHQLRFAPGVFSSPEVCGKILEKDRRDLVQLLGFGRMTPEEYEAVSAEYEKLAQIFPCPEPESDQPRRLSFERLEDRNGGDQGETFGVA